MRRPLLKASPAAIRRAMAMYAPHDRPVVLPVIKTKQKQVDQKTLDLAAKPIESKDTAQK